MIKQTTLHNILTWVIAVILFIFQSLNYFIAWIKKYGKHGEKTTTVVTADTTISYESNPNSKNAHENVITVQGLIQKHFDIPLIIAEDEPKVYNFIKSAQLLTSNEICKEKKKIDEFMENLVDDSYVARGLGLITATVGRQSEFYLYSKYDNNFENIVIKLNGRNGEVGEITILNQNPANIVETKSIPINYFYDKDRIKVTYTPFAEGVYTLTLVRNSLPICRSPYYISVEKSTANSRSQIRLGTKKYKPVTKFAKAKHLSLETCDHSIPAIELSKPSICRNIRPVSEENSIRTDVMSIVTKFESNNMSVQKKVHKHAPSITERGSETDLIDDISTYSNIKPKIETDNVYYNVSDLNSHNAQSKSKSTGKNFWNDVDITYRNNKASDINAIDFASERIKKPMTNFNKNIRITKAIPWVKESSTRLRPTNSVLEESLNDENSHDVENRNQTFKTNKFIDEKTHVETLLDSKTRIDEYKIKCIDNEPCIQNEPSCFNDDDRKTVVVLNNINKIKSNKNNAVIQQITDSAQYNINTPFASVITKITNGVCEKCSIQVLKIISEIPRDINMTHDNNSKEMRSSFETLLAQPISININTDNMFEHPINASNEQSTEHSLTNSPTKIKRMGTTDKDIKYQYLNEIEPINNNSDELCSDINNPSTELTIKPNKPNSEISKTIKDKIIDHLNTSELVTIINDKNTYEELVRDEFKINNVIIPDKNTNIPGSIMDNAVLASMEVTSETSKCNSENNEEQTKNITFKNVTLASTKNEIQKLMIEKSIEPVLTSFKNKMVSKITQLYLNKDLSNTDNTTTVETHDKHLTNNLEENQIHNIANNTEINTKCIETLTSRLKNHIDKNEITEIILDEKKTANNHLFKYVENIIKTNICDMYTQTLGEKKLQTLVNTAMNHPNDQKIDNEFKKMILDNETQDFKLKKMNNGKIVQVVEAILAETQSVAIIKNTDKLTSSKNEVTIETKSPLINDFNSIKRDNTSTDIKQEMQTINENENFTVVEPNPVEIKELPNIQKSHNTEIINSIIELQPTLETQIMNTSELVTVGEQSLKGIQFTIEIIQSNIPEENDEIENINDKRKNKSVQLQINENENIIIKIPHLVEKKTINEIVENIRVNTSTKSNSTKNVSMQQTKKQEIQTLKLKKVLDASDENTERKIVYPSTPINIAENIFIDEPNPQITPTRNEHVSNNEAKITIGIKTSEPQFSKTTITGLIPSKIPMVENNSINPKQRILNTLNKLDAIEKLTIPKYSTTCDTKKATIKLKNASESTISPKQLYIMENNMLEKTENTDKTSTPNDTEIETLELLNENEKMKSIPSFTNDTSVQTTLESKTEKNTLQKTFDSKHNLTTIESTVNEINCKNNKNETTIQTSSTAEEVEEKPIKSHTEIERTPLIDAPSEPNLKVDEMLIDTKAETPGFIITPTASSTRKILVEFVTRKNQKPIETLAIIVHEQMEENIVTARKIPSTMNSITVVMDEEVRIKPHGSGTYNAKLDDKVRTTETKTRISIDQQNAEKIIEKEPEIRQQTNSIKGVVVEKTKVNIGRENQKLLPTVASTSSVEEINETNKLIETLPIQSTIEYSDVSKEIEDINETEKKSSCTISSIVTVEESPEQINSSDGVVGENTKENIDKEHAKLLLNDTSSGSMKQHKEMDELIENVFKMESTEESMGESIQHITATAETCIDSTNVILDIQMDEVEVLKEEYSEPISSIGEKTNDKEPPTATVNSSGKVIAENTNENIDTEKQTFLPIETPTSLMKELVVKEGTTEIKLSIESTMESTEEPKEEKGITETEITSYTESSAEIINDQNHEDLIVTQEPPAESISSDEVAGQKKLVEVDIENAKPLPIESEIGSLEEPIMEEDRTETEISCTHSSIVVVHSKIDVDKELEEGTVVPFNYSDEVVGEKINMDIDTEKQTFLPIETPTSLIKELEVKEETTEIKLPIESTMESTEEPKEEKGITETEITSYTESSAEIINDQNHEDLIVTQEPPSESFSSNQRVGDNTTVNIDTENKTPLFIEPIEEPEVEGDRTEKEILSCTDSSNITIDVQTGVEKVIGIESSSQIISVDEKNIKQEHMVPNDSSDELLGENKKLNIHRENETIEPKAVPGVGEDKTENEISSCTDSSILTVDAQTENEKCIEEESPVPINSPDEVVGQKKNVEVDIENAKNLPIESDIGSLEEPITEEDRTEIELSCTHSSIVVVHSKIDVDKELEEGTVVPFNYSDEVVGEKINMDIDTEKQTFLPIETPTSLIKELEVKEETTEIKLPIESTMESTEEPKEEKGITETEITSYTESSAEIINDQNHEDLIVAQEPPAEGIFSDEVAGQKKNVEVDIENAKPLPIESDIGSLEEPIMEEDKTETELSCTHSSIVVVHSKIDVDKEHEEGTVVPINYSDEVQGEKVNMDIDTETETLLIPKKPSYLVEKQKVIEGTTKIVLPIESSTECTGKPKAIEDNIVETELISCTESSTQMIGDQKHVDRIVFLEPSSESFSSNQIVGDNMTVNIDTENKTPLFIEPIEEPEVEGDRTEKKILSCTDSSTANIYAQMKKEEYIEEEVSEPNNSSNDEEGENMKDNSDKENIKLLPNKISTRLMDEMKVIKEETEITLLIETTIAPTEERNIGDDLTETEITSCTESSIKIIDHQINQEKIVDQEHPVTNHSLDEILSKITKVNLQTEKETHLLIESVIEFITEKEVDEDKTETDISFTDSSNTTLDPQMSNYKYREEESPELINSSDEEVVKNNYENIDKENEKLLKIYASSGSMIENEKINKPTETLLPIQSTIESIGQSVESIGQSVEDITALAVTSSIDSSSITINIQKDVEKIIEEETFSQNILVGKKSISQETLVVNKSQDQLVEENTNGKIDTEKETLSIITCACLMEKRNVIQGTAEVPLPIESVMDSTEKRKISEDMTKTKITSSTISSREIFENLINADTKKVDQEDPNPNNSSDELLGENKKVNFDIENAKPLPIESVVGSLEAPIMEEERTEAEISCTDSPIVVEHSKIDVDKDLERGTVIPINYSDGLVGEKINMVLDTETETLVITKTPSDMVQGRNVIEGTTKIVLPIESSIECMDIAKGIENNIVETEITSYTESSAEIINDQNHEDLIVTQEPPSESFSSNQRVGDNTTVNIDTENKTPLFIEPIEEPEVEGDRTEKKILSCTDSSNITIDVQTGVEKVIGIESSSQIISVDEKNIKQEHMVPNDSSDELLGENKKLNIHRENETIEPEAVPGVGEDKTENEISSCTDSSILTVDAQTENEKCIEEESPVPINSPDEVVGRKKNVEVDIENAKNLPIESDIGSLEEPITEEDRTEIELSCTHSSIVVVHSKIDVDKELEEGTVVPFNYSDEVVGEKINMDIDTEKQTFLPIETPTSLIKELEVKEETTEIKLPIESTMESTEEPKEEKGITETEITSYTESSAEIINDQNHEDLIVAQEPPAEGIFSDEVAGQKKNVEVDIENAKPLPIESDIGSLEEPIMEEDRTETEISCTHSSIVVVHSKIDVDKELEEGTVVPFNYSDEVVGEKINMDIDTEKQTFLPIETPTSLIKELEVKEETTEIKLPIESTMESTEEPKEEKGITETEITSYTESSAEIINDQNHEDLIVAQEPPAEGIFSDEVAGQKKNVEVDIENAKPLPIESEIGSLEEPIMEEDRTETELSCTHSSIVVVHYKIDVDKDLEEGTVVPFNYSDEVVGEKINMDIDTETETLLIPKTPSDMVQGQNVIEGTTEIVLPIESAIECTDIAKVIEDNIVETKLISCTESSTQMVGDQKHVDRIVFLEPPSESFSSNQIVGDNTTVNIDTENKTPLFIEPIAKPGLEEDRTKKEILSFTDSPTTNIEVKMNKEIYTEEESSEPNNHLNEVVGKKSDMNIEVIDDHNHRDTNIDQEPLLSNSSSDEVVGENTNVPMGSIIGSTEASKEVEFIFETENTPCINSSTITVDIQTDEENNMKKESPTPINCLGKMLDENTKVNIDKENETLLQVDISSTAVEAVKEKKIMENEHSISSFLIAEKQINIIDSKTKTLSPMETYMTFVDEPNVVGGLTESEHEAHIDSSTTNLKKQIKIDSETEIETLSLIDNLTESVKEQIVKINENKSPTLIDSPSEIVGQGNKMDIDTDNQTPLPINTSPTTVDDKMVKNIIENETPIYCLVDVVEERTEVNIENNFETSKPIDIITASAGEQLNVEYLSENKHTVQIEKESRNETSTPVNYSAAITIEQTDVQNLAERTLPTDDVSYRNTKTENSDNPNNRCLKFEETSKMLSLENKDNLQRKSYGIQKLEMSVQRVKTSDEDYYEKTFVQLEQTEKISKEDNVNVDGENKTISDDKLYTVNESDLNAILCASSLEEALTLLDSKIKFKFKHKKSSKINAKEFIPKIQTSESQSSGVNTNFTDAREFFKEIEKKSKK